MENGVIQLSLRGGSVISSNFFLVNFVNQHWRNLEIPSHTRARNSTAHTMMYQRSYVFVPSLA